MQKDIMICLCCTERNSEYARECFHNRMMLSRNSQEIGEQSYSEHEEKRQLQAEIGKAENNKTNPKEHCSFIDYMVKCDLKIKMEAS